MNQNPIFRIDSDRVWVKPDPVNAPSCYGAILKSLSLR